MFSPVAHRQTWHSLSVKTHFIKFSLSYVRNLRTVTCIHHSCYHKLEEKRMSKRVYLTGFSGDKLAKHVTTLVLACSNCSRVWQNRFCLMCSAHRGVVRGFVTLSTDCMTIGTSRLASEKGQLAFSWIYLPEVAGRQSGRQVYHISNLFFFNSAWPTSLTVCWRSSVYGTSVFFGTGTTLDSRTLLRFTVITCFTRCDSRVMHCSTRDASKQK